MNDELLTPVEAAKKLKVGVDTLEAWRGKRIGPAWIKLGDGKRAPVRYRLSVIEQYLKDREQT